jgi:GNAT superfamily N-acetyltransferase
MGPEGDLVAKRMARGCRCFAAWGGDEVLAYGWLSSDAEWIGELEMEIRPTAGEAYVWNCFTIEAHRGKGLFGALLRAIALQAGREGLARLWIGSLDIPAQRAVGAAGFVPVLRFATETSGGQRLLTVEPADGADPALLAAALEVMGVDGRPLQLGSSTSQSQHRRH